MESAAPEVTRNWPITAPSAMRTPTSPTVPPKPEVKEEKVSTNGIPAMSARPAEPSMRERNGWTFAHTMRTMISAMPTTAETTRRESEAVVTTSSSARTLSAPMELMSSPRCRRC